MELIADHQPETGRPNQHRGAQTEHGTLPLAGSYAHHVIKTQAGADKKECQQTEQKGIALLACRYIQNNAAQHGQCRNGNHHVRCNGCGAFKGILAAFRGEIGKSLQAPQQAECPGNGCGAHQHHDFCPKTAGCIKSRSRLKGGHILNPSKKSAECRGHADIAAQYHRVFTHIAAPVPIHFHRVPDTDSGKHYLYIVTV